MQYRIEWLHLLPNYHHIGAEHLHYVLSWLLVMMAFSPGLVHVEIETDLVLGYEYCSANPTKRTLPILETTWE